MIVDNKFVRFINRNIKVILIVILLILGCYILLRVVNKNIRDSNKTIINNNVEKNENTDLQKSVISNTNVSKNDTEENKKIIDDFINYCNQGAVESAYALLTDDCKDALYKTVDIFKKDYIDQLFTEKRDYNLKTWISKNNIVTYKLALQGDMLSTGNVNNNSIEEYITVVNDNDVRKLNVNSFVCRTKVYKKSNQGNIEVKAITKDIYMDYEIYKFNVCNNSDSNILLDTLESENSIYLLASVGNNEVEFSAYIDELDQAYLYLTPGMSKDIYIKFNKMYSDTNAKINSIVFSNVVSNYNDYIAYNDYAHVRDTINVSENYKEDTNLN